MKETQRTDHGPLAGISVVEVADLHAAQYCGRILADLGADVTKVEAAPLGDPVRIVSAHDSRRSHLFPSLNAGKQSLGLDPDASASIDLVRDLVGTSDVLLIGLSAGVEPPWSLDTTRMRTVNEGLVICVVSPFGMTGPLSGQSATDATLQALAGTAWMTGEPGGPPYPTAAGLSHTMTGMQAALAIGQALLARERSGRGDSIDLAMLDVVFGMDCAINPMVASERGAFRPEPIGRFHFAETIGIYRGTEGFIVIEVWGQGTDSTWARLARALDRPDLIDDPDFLNDQMRVLQWDTILPLVEGWVQSFHSDAEAIEALDAAQVVCGRILSPAAAVGLPPAVVRGFIRNVEQSGGGIVPVMATPYRMPGSPATVGRAPVFGEHGAEILGRRLGFPAEEIADLHRTGVVVGTGSRAS